MEQICHVKLEIYLHYSLALQITSEASGLLVILKNRKINGSQLAKIKKNIPDMSLP